jgi:hypothetical protein
MEWRRHIALGCALALAIVVPSASQQAEQTAPKTIGEIFASDASVQGAVQLAGAGMQVMSGSAIGAGQSPARLRLTRGGEVRVCPRTSLSISSSHSGRDLIFGMNAGAVEADYSLAASADAILTPDFRILLAGPGKFHLAIGADARGNTCVRPLANNTASVIVSELMGDGTYQVRPEEQVVFRNGKLTQPDHVVGECGCPAPPPVMRAAAEPEAPKREAPPAPAISTLHKVTPPSMSIPLYVPAAAPAAVASNVAPVPAPTNQEVHVEVDAPFYFSALDPEPELPAQVAELKFNWQPPLPYPVQPPKQAEVLQPPPPVPAAPVEVAQETPKNKGFFGKIRSFFASVFH